MRERSCPHCGAPYLFTERIGTMTDFYCLPCGFRRSTGQDSFMTDAESLRMWKHQYRDLSDKPIHGLFLRV